MDAIASLQPNSTVAIYDDQDDSRDSTADSVVDAGFRPIIIQNPYHSLEDCIEGLSVYDAALIDHRLSPGNFGDFYGAEVVRQLYLGRKPALLITAWAYGDPEALQPFNRYLVNVVKKGDENEIEQIRFGFNTFAEEMQNRFLPQRRPTKTIFTVATDFRGNEESGNVEAFIPSWNPNEGVSFPVDFIPEELIPLLKKGRQFFADINTGADSQHDLFFENIELAEID